MMNALMLAQSGSATGWLDASNFGPLFAIGSTISAGLIALGVVVYRLSRRNASERERERTTRDLAAHVAEGSMTAQEAERLLRAGTEPGRGR